MVCADTIITTYSGREVKLVNCQGVCSLDLMKNLASAIAGCDQVHEHD